MHDQRPADGPDPGPQDNLFLETLFAAMCRNLFVLPGDTLVDQAHRWIDALRFTVAKAAR